MMDLIPTAVGIHFNEGNQRASKASHISAWETSDCRVMTGGALCDRAAVDSLERSVVWD